MKILEISRVAPPPPSPESASPTNPLPLTFFDIQWLRFSPTQRVYFYEIPLTLTSFTDTIVPKLKHSLSLILQHYLPLAGNLIWPHHSHKPVIQFGDGDDYGVLLTVAESDADFHYLSGEGFREAAAYHPLVPKLPSSDERGEVISLQVTLFQNKGFAIGITSHHAILDGKTSTTFMKSWAQICKGGSSSPMTELIPFYDRTSILDPTCLEEIFLNAWQNVDGPNNRSLSLWSFKIPPDLIRWSVEITRENLEKLKKWVLNKQEDQKNHQNQQPVHISSFTVTCAFLWDCAVKAKRLSEGEVLFIFTVDARSRIEPPLPMNYFGNCIVCRRSFVKTKELLGENGVMVAIEGISEQIKGLEEGVLKGTEKLAENLTGVSKDGPIQTLFSVSGSPRFEVYSADFGWGKPRKVEVISIDQTQAFSLSEARNGNGGIEIGVVGKRSEIETFTALFAEGLEAL